MRGKKISIGWKKKMKIVKKALAALTVITIVALIGCASKPKVKVVEMENKGTAMNIKTPEWIKSYISGDITAVQKLSQYKDKYCIIGQESGVNKQFVLTWSDNFSAQQRIGALLRTTIASKYQAQVQGTASTSGGANSSTSQAASTGDVNQQINSAINAIVDVSYSGAQREADWWVLTRRYDPDQKDLFTDEYTAYVLYTIPKKVLDTQIAKAMETAVKKDSVLYDITIQLAKQILLNGMENWGEGAN